LIVEVFQIVRSEHMAAEGVLLWCKYKSASWFSAGACPTDKEEEEVEEEEVEGEEEEVEKVEEEEFE
jgi:hypothetical protein